MHSVRILPRLAWGSIRKNIPTYLPYIFATSFAVLVFFIFSAIAANPIMQTMPHAGYLSMLMQIGMVLLGIILVPFLFYTNSFLMKRRKNELGLYSILGLEKRHIGLIVAAETVFICVASLILGILMALAFSRLIFLLLLNITDLPVNITFTAPLSCYVGTAVFFGCVFLLNLIINLIQVYRSRPADLFQSARKGEKPPKRLWPTAVLGLAALGTGYYLAVGFRLNSAFLLIVFAAILLVVVGTYCLFSAGIIMLLRVLKGNRRFYYKKSNFVTVSGMLYRMRKNAASLSNICIFSTMVIITLICTVSLFKGLPSITSYRHPYDVDIRFISSKATDREATEQKLLSEAQAQNITLAAPIAFEYMTLNVDQKGSSFQEVAQGQTDYRSVYAMRVLTLEDYNRIHGSNESLEPDEALFFTNGADAGLREIQIAERFYRIKSELPTLIFESKEPRALSSDYYLIVPSREDQQYLYEAMNRTEDQWIYTVRFNLEGSQEGIEAFTQGLSQWIGDTPGFSVLNSRLNDERQDRALLGGLLFLGIFFGIIFMVCMIMIMYYKQLSEGYEDKNNFDVMQQVGMSQSEVKATIGRQILIVFFLPLVMALLHTAVALGAVETMLNTLNLYNHKLIVFSTIGVSLAFTGIYSVSYQLTAKAYYRLVRR
ncbi:ABC transporter permease [Oscillospiraceae bacterium MB08-C2-2]|nr:ABC transporter permease [Oscillospiraceae bacterium MB08-C2-2]